MTGGAGYVGSHTVKSLAADGYDVVVYDDLSQGHRAAVERLARRFGPAGRRIELVEGDIRDQERLGTVLIDAGVEAVLHFAAWLSVGDSIRDPVGYYRNNVVGALSVLEAMAGAAVRRFVFSSTCAVYGEPERTPITESHPTRPINAYGQTKLAIEQALPHHERAYGLGWVVLRYFNAAGADVDGDLGEAHDPEIHLIPRAIDAAGGGRALEIHGADYPTPDGTCQRDYVHVDDLARAHVLGLRCLEAGRESGVFNLGTGRPFSVREVIDVVGRVTGRPVPHDTGPRRPGDPAVLFASNDRARQDLGWTPAHPALEDIVRTAAAWRARHPSGYPDVAP